MSKILLIAVFLIGVVSGCVLWYGAGDGIVSYFASDEISPQEEINRTLKCLGMDN